VQVMPGSPAQKAGLQPFTRGSEGNIVPGDVITAVNDEPVTDIDSLLSVFERFKPGDKVTLSLSRAGKTRKQEVTLGTSEES
jgi:S1-C subfamily serine protease